MIILGVLAACKPAGPECGAKPHDLFETSLWAKKENLMQQNNEPLQETQQWIEIERQRAAAGRSYTTPAIITLVLYCVLWLPGLIANIVYWLEARKTEQLIGRAPEGKGCLTAMLVVSVALVFLLILVGGLALFLP